MKLKYKFYTTIFISAIEKVTAKWCSRIYQPMCASCLGNIYKEINFSLLYIVCKFFVTEFQARLAETEKSKEVLHTGHGLDSRKKKKISYSTS